MSKTPINRSQGRSVVVSTRGIVATEHPLASQAGAMVLAEGGHAVDAAIAANAVMGVVCPMMCGIGGDLFAIVCERGGRLHGVNASGWAPAAPDARVSRDARRLTSMPQSGVHSVTVPGAVARMGASARAIRPCAAVAHLLEPAIALADEGFPVAEITSEEWRNPGGVPARRSGGGADVSARRAAARTGRDFPEPRSRLDVPADCRAMAARLLSRRSRAAARRRSRAPRLDAWPPPISRSFSAQWVEPDFDELSRMGGLRDSAERRGHRRADDAEHPGSASRIGEVRATIRSMRCT